VRTARTHGHAVRVEEIEGALVPVAWAVGIDFAGDVDGRRGREVIAGGGLGEGWDNSEREVCPAERGPIMLDVAWGAKESGAE
jgi:hypothetical protein